MKTIVFFCKGDATDRFRRRVAKATCTKYRACAQKLSAEFRSLASSGPRPLIPTPSEPLQINLFGESLKDPPKSTCTEGFWWCWIEVAMVPGPIRAWTRSLIFAAISHTSCLWPSPLCSEMVGRTTFYRKTQYKINLFGLRWSLVPQWRVSGMLMVIFWPNWGDILTKYYQKLPKVQFLQNEDVSKFQECLFFRNKSPAGCTLT